MYCTSSTPPALEGDPESEPVTVGAVRAYPKPEGSDDAGAWEQGIIGGAPATVENESLSDVVRNKLVRV